MARANKVLLAGAALAAGLGAALALSQGASAKTKAAPLSPGAGRPPQVSNEWLNAYPEDLENYLRAHAETVAALIAEGQDPKTIYTQDDLFALDYLLGEYGLDTLRAAPQAALGPFTQQSATGYSVLLEEAYALELRGNEGDAAAQLIASYDNIAAEKESLA